MMVAGCYGSAAGMDVNRWTAGKMIASHIHGLPWGNNGSAGENHHILASESHQTATLHTEKNYLGGGDLGLW